MDRMACVDVPALPLQILLRRHPDWESLPVAIVDRDKPLGIIRWVNENARRVQILPGMRYATALSLSRDLRAGVVADTEIAEYVGRLTRWLWRFSPGIEPSSREPGVFWVDASGLCPLYTSLQEWALEVRDNLRQAGFESVVGIGFSRFGSYAAARSSSGIIVFRNTDHEHKHLRAVPIDRLGFEPDLRDKLFKLGIRTLGGFIDLPAVGIRKRFGLEAHALHEMARGSGWAPLEPEPYRAPIVRTILLEYPETNLDRLLVNLEPRLQSILTTLASKGAALASIRIALELDDGERHHERLSPATPTLDVPQLLTLIRLRLETLTLSAGVTELEIKGVGSPASQRQLELFREKPRRNLEAVKRAFAKIRAELGNDAVMRAQLHDGHLPEARFGWELLEELALPEPTEVAHRPLVRRLYSPPIQLPPRARHEPDGWLIARFADGPVVEVIGPHIVSGGWWTRETSRAYHYVRTRSGRWLWIYNDRKRRRWFLHGEVE